MVQGKIGKNQERWVNTRNSGIVIGKCYNILGTIRNHLKIGKSLENQDGTRKNRKIPGTLGKYQELWGSNRKVL